MQDFRPKIGKFRCLPKRDHPQFLRLWRNSRVCGKNAVDIRPDLNLLRIKGGAAMAVPVRTGIRDSIMVEIASGLQPGDTVITMGVLLVRPGAPVSVRIAK